MSSVLFLETLLLNNNIISLQVENVVNNESLSNHLLVFHLLDGKKAILMGMKGDRRQELIDITIGNQSVLKDLIFIKDVSERFSKLDFSINELDNFQYQINSNINSLLLRQNEKIKLLCEHKNLNSLTEADQYLDLMIENLTTRLLSHYVIFYYKFFLDEFFKSFLQLTDLLRDIYLKKSNGWSNKILGKIFFLKHFIKFFVKV